jgi:hypothetical protein
MERRLHATFWMNKEVSIMKAQPFVIGFLGLGLILSFPSHSAAQTGTDTPVTTQSEVRLDAPTMEAVVDQLFGAPDGGLLDGTRSFQLRAKNMELTSAQSADFFSATSTENLATLVEGTETLHGVVHLQGEIDGEDFELKISGRQLKLDGITLTAAQLDALTSSLREVEGLKQIKINAIVDGEKTTIRLQGNLLKSDPAVREAGRENGRRGLDRAHEVRNEHAERIEHLGRIERPERGEGRR